jgi:hypothetical protein
MEDLFRHSGVNRLITQALDRLTEETEIAVPDLLHVAQMASAKHVSHSICVDASCYESVFDVEIIAALVDLEMS